MGRGGTTALQSPDPSAPDKLVLKLKTFTAEKGGSSDSRCLYFILNDRITFDSNTLYNIPSEIC